MSIHVANDEEFKQFVQRATNENVYLIVKFSAKWCGPCKAIQPKFDALSNECKNGYCISVDVDECQGVSANYSVTALPTFLVIKGGQVKATLQGANPKGLLTMFQSCAAGHL